MYALEVPFWGPGCRFIIEKIALYISARLALGNFVPVGAPGSPVFKGGKHIIEQMFENVKRFLKVF